MFIPLILGSATLLVSMAVQVVVVVLMLRYLVKALQKKDPRPETLGLNIYVIGMVLLILFAGNIMQISIWATLFIVLGEFNDFMTAFYHSMVNFSSLGYGDIVMSEKWRLLGAFEASNGVLMFGLTSGTILAIMSRLFTRQQTSPVFVNRQERPDLRG